MDDEPLLRTPELTEMSTVRRDFPSVFLDLNLSSLGTMPRWQSAPHLITNDAIIPIITTRHSSPFVNLIANLTKKRRLAHHSHLAPSVLTFHKESTIDGEDPWPSLKWTPLFVQRALWYT